MNPGLLPEGLRDRLPPQAERQATIMRALLDCIASHGYDRVAPPLAEFEDSLALVLKSASRQDLMRVVDPMSQRTLALRPDITAQVGRIAATQLGNAPRPLRLSYGGPVIKLRATQLRPEREMLQVGAELIGSDGIAAAREIASVAVEAVGRAGATGVTIDVTMPDLVDTLADTAMPVPEPARGRLRDLLDAKDAGGLVQAGFGTWLPLVEATGPIDDALARLSALPGADAIAARLDAVRDVVAGLDARVTLDPTERHGFAYQNWFGFSLFAAGVASELGRGGSYAIVHGDGRDEPAMGFSLYPDALLETADVADVRPSLFVPLDSDRAAAAAMRAQGWRTVAAIASTCEAQRLGCTHRLDGNEAVAL